MEASYVDTIIVDQITAINEICSPSPLPEVGWRARLLKVPTFYSQACPPDQPETLQEPPATRHVTVMQKDVIT